MRRRVQVVERAAPEVSFPELVVDEWVDAADLEHIRAHLATTLLNGEVALDVPGELDWAVWMFAYRRWQHALRDWAAKHGIARSEVAALEARARSLSRRHTTPAR